MISLKDVIRFWLTTNKNLSRSWELSKDHNSTWALVPKFSKHYKPNVRITIFNDCIKLHYDNDGYPDDKACHTETIEAYDVELFRKLAHWMHFVRRK